MSNNVKPVEDTRKVWKRNLHFMGRKVPTWALILSTVIAGAGAATGIILADDIPGAVVVSVSQAILVEKPIVTGDYDQRFSSVSDDGTMFTAGVEANNGDSFAVNVPVRNEANGDIVVEMTVFTGTNTAGVITVDLDGSGLIDDVVRFDNWTWKFTADADANGDDDSPVVDGVCIKVAIADDADPGFYHIQGTLRPVKV